MRILPINISESRKLFEDNKNILVRGECYNNCIKLLGVALSEEFLDNKVKMGYCYVGGENHFLIRHGVIIKDNEVLDPTIFLTKSEEELKKAIEEGLTYHVIAELDIFRLNLGFKIDDRVSSMPILLRDCDKEMFKYLQEHTELRVNNVDYANFLWQFEE